MKWVIVLLAGILLVLTIFVAVWLVDRQKVIDAADTAAARERAEAERQLVLSNARMKAEAEAAREEESEQELSKARDRRRHLEAEAWNSEPIMQGFAARRTKLNAITDHHEELRETLKYNEDLAKVMFAANIEPEAYLPPFERAAAIAARRAAMHPATTRVSR